MNFWTKKNVENMAADELIRWNNEIFENLERAKQYNMTLKSERAFHMIQKELKKRKII